jgi:transposase
MRAYSLDLRQRIVDAYTHGEGSMRELAERFAVALNTVQSYVLLARTKGTPAPRAHGGGPVAKMDEAALNELRALVEEKSDRTLAQLAEELVARGHLQMSLTTIDRGLAHLGITRKKNTSRERARSA